MNDAGYMQRAIELARRGIGLASPGALVGAVIVKDGSIVGEGFYTYDGLDHAEILALRQAGPAAQGATIYISQEPCSHFGKTPPCTTALLAAGIVRVVAAVQDPFPPVNGAGLAILRDSGIDVHCGVLEDEARRMNEAFLTWAAEGRPFGILKIGMTLDGKIATRTGESQWITSAESRAAVHEMRRAADAVVTGSGTFLQDRPQMTDRSGRPRRRELQRIVLDRRGRIPDASGDAAGWLVFRGSLEELILEMRRREIQSFLLECGPDLAFAAIQSGFIDKIAAFVAPKVLGGRDVPAIGGVGIESLAGAIGLHDWSVGTTGPDIVITAYVHRNH